MTRITKSYNSFSRAFKSQLEKPQFSKSIALFNKRLENTRYFPIPTPNGPLLPEQETALKKFYRSRCRLKIFIENERNFYENTCFGKVLAVLERLGLFVSSLTEAQLILRRAKPLYYKDRIQVLETKKTLLKELSTKNNIDYYIENCFKKATKENYAKKGNCLKEPEREIYSVLVKEDQLFEFQHLPTPIPIANGASRALFSGKNDKGEAVAIITVKEDLNSEKKERVVENAEKEATLLETNLKNTPGILKVDAFFKTSSEQFFLVAEMYPDGDLEDYLKTKAGKENNPIPLMKSLIKAVYHLHQKKYIHFDIKPKNIVIKYDEKLKQYVACLIDFEGAKSFIASPLEKLNSANTPEYLAPEIGKSLEQCTSLKELTQTTQAVLTEKCDVWSLGLTLYQLYYQKKLPLLCNEQGSFLDRTEIKKTLNTITQEAIDSHFKDKTDSVSELIKQTLTVDPKKRPDMETVLNAINRITLPDQLNEDFSSIFGEVKLEENPKFTSNGILLTIDSNAISKQLTMDFLRPGLASLEITTDEGKFEFLETNTQKEITETDKTAFCKSTNESIEEVIIEPGSCEEKACQRLRNLNALIGFLQKDSSCAVDEGQTTKLLQFLCSQNLQRLLCKQYFANAYALYQHLPISSVNALPKNMQVSIKKINDNQWDVTLTCGEIALSEEETLNKLDNYHDVKIPASFLREDSGSEWQMKNGKYEIGKKSK